MDVFNIHIEFDSQVFRNTVEQHIKEKKKAYVCVVDANVITIAQKDLKYRKIVKNATINTCDGSSISKMVNSIYGTHYSAFNGPELFEYYIERPYKHVLVGNTAKKVEQIKEFVKQKGVDVDLKPKQETFISNIFPYIEQGVLFGIGAAFNFYTGDLHNNKKEIGGLRFIWLERIFKEPKKQLKRVFGYMMAVPKMYFDEKRKAKATRQV